MVSKNILKTTISYYTSYIYLQNRRIIMNKLFLSILFILSLIGSTSVAQTSIWKVSNENNHLYLGGSVHILRETDYPLPSEFNKVFNESNKIIFETDISALENPAVAQSMMMKGMYGGDTTIQDVISTKVYEQLAEECAKIPLPLKQMSKLKPSIIIMTMSIMKMQQLGISAQGVDKHYYSKAIASKKDVGQLESLDLQLDLITSMGGNNEEEFIKYSLKDFNDLEKELTEMIETWRNGSSKIMKRQIKEMKSDYPTIYKDLLVNRNNNWLPQIESFLTDDKVEFVVVGSLHMHGEDGLLSLLKEKGYQVEQYID